jgi:hypothetical protein
VRHSVGMESADARRPASATAVGIILLTLAAAAVVLGLVVSWASNCCGSADASDPAPTLVGFGVGAALGLAGLGLIGGWMHQRALVATTAVVPATCIAAAPWSFDLGILAPFALIAWGLFALFLRRAGVAAWLLRAQKPV